MTVANPYETIEPSTTYDALEDTARFLGILSSRDKAVEFISNLDPSRIVLSVQGHIVDPPLDGFELMLATTVDHYGRMYGDSPIGAITMLATLKEEVKSGGVFVGEPVLANPPSQPQQ